MQRTRNLLIALIVSAVVMPAWGCSVFLPSQSDKGISTSGFIEATDIAIAPEISARIVSIAVAEGETAKAGVSLVKLDDSLLQAQQRQAEATVTQAQAASDQARAMVDQAQAAVEQATMSRNLAIANRDGAKKAWDDALDVQKRPLTLDAAVIAAQG